MDYYQKYLKYKIKYSNLKLQYGGECKPSGLSGMFKNNLSWLKDPKNICDALKQDCNASNITLNLDYKKEMLTKKCIPPPDILHKWYGVSEEVVKFDLLGYPGTEQLYSAEDYKAANFTVQDVLRNLLIEYASEPIKNAKLYDKVKKCIDILGFYQFNEDEEYKNGNEFGNSFMLFIRYLIEKNAEKKLPDLNYNELMKSLKTFFEKMFKSNNSKGIELIKKTIIQTFILKFSERNFNLIYKGINSLFTIELSYLLSSNIFAWDSNLKSIPKINQIVINFILEELKKLSNEKIMELLKSNNINYLAFFYQYLQDKIITIKDINLLLQPTGGGYYTNLFYYFPEKAIKLVNDLNVNDIVSKFNSNLIPAVNRKTIEEILIKKLEKLLEQKNYINFYELLFESQTILNKEKKQSLYKLITSEESSSKQSNSEYIVAILKKFLKEVTTDTTEKTKNSTIIQFAMLMVVAFMYGFKIYGEINNIIIMLMKRLSLSEPDFYLHQYRQFAGTPKYYTKDEYDAFNSFIEKKGILYSGIQQAEITKITQSYQPSVVKTAQKK